MSCVSINYCHMCTLYNYYIIIVRRQATTVDDCTVDDCMIDDGCITEESYNAGLFDSCYGELMN